MLFFPSKSHQFIAREFPLHALLYEYGRILCRVDFMERVTEDLGEESDQFKN